MARYMGLIGLGAVYLASMLAVTFGAASEWHLADWYALKALTGRSPIPFSSRVILLDESAAYARGAVKQPRLREALANFIEHTSRLPDPERPDAIVLDFDFANDASAQTKRLVAAIKNLPESIHVYAAQNLDPLLDVSYSFSSADPYDFDRALATYQPEIYGSPTTAAAAQSGHTFFDQFAGPNAVAYRDCFQYPTTQGYAGESVALALLAAGKKPATCEPEETVVLLGPSPKIPADQFQPVSAAGTTDGVVADRIVILGAPSVDRGKFGSVTHPELLAWAISDALQGDVLSATAFPGLFLPLLVAGLSVLTLVLFLASFMSLRRLSNRQRLALPWLCSAVAVAGALASFFVVEIVLSHRLLQPQVTLPSIGAVLAGVLAGFWGYDATLRRLREFHAETEEPSDYDVFVSYAHDDGAWVVAHVYEPLNRVRLSNGRKLRIFFDKDSIEVSDAWQRDIALAVSGSRFIVAVYSDVYFSRNYCLYELLRAQRKWVESGLAQRCVFPVMLGHPKIPPEYEDIQGVSVDDDPSAVQTVVRHIVDALERDSN